MKPFSLYFSTLVIAVVLAAASVHSVPAQPAQIAPQPAPTPNDDDVVKISTDLIQLDVTVTDKSENAVTDLKAEDFQVFENGKERKISFFSFVRPNAATSSISGASVKLAENSNNGGPSPMKIEQVGRIIAIVVDDSNMTTESIAKVRKDLKALIEDKMQPNDLFAIIKTSRSVAVLQQFTNDKQALLAAIDGITYQPITAGSLAALPPARIGLSQNLSSGLNLADDPAQSRAPQSPFMPSAERGAESAESKVTELSKKGGISTLDNESLVNAINQEDSASGSLAVLKKVLDAMGNLKGRKFLMFISPGINRRFSLNERDNPLGVSAIQIVKLNNANTINIAGKSHHLDDLLQVITETANRNSVSIFTFDPGGAITTSLDATQSTQGTIQVDRVQVSGKTDNSEISSPVPRTDPLVTARNDDIRLKQDGLKMLADETGGKVFINNNDLSGGLRSAMDSQGGYYLLAYEPDEKTFDAKNSRFNKLEVKIKRPGVKVSQRSGFFNSAEINPKDEKNTGKDDGLLKKIFLPYDYSDVKVDMASVYAGTENNRSTIRSFVNISPETLKLNKDASGKNIAKFDIIMVAFDPTGRVSGSSARNFTIAFDDKAREGFLRNGLISTVRTEVEAPGNYRFRVLVRDNNADIYGTFTQSVVIPDQKKDAITFSGLLLQNYTLEEMQEAQTNPAAAAAKAAAKMQNDTAYRRFAHGTTLTYAYVVYLMPGVAKAGDPKITLTAKLLKDGQPLMALKPEELAITPSGAVQRGTFRGGINLDSTLPAGKYVLQITANAEKAKVTETQSIDFEVLP